MTRFFKLTALVLAGVLLLATVGCYGSFPLTMKVYKWNGTFGDKWVNEIGFLALNIIPVYGVASTVDVLILNSIEFWTGKDAMSSNLEQVDPWPNIVTNEDGSITLSSQDGKTLTVTAADDGAVICDAGGNVLARSVRTDDGVTVYSPDGELLGSMTNQQLAALQTR